ncbi:hypothetical protein [uncultured Clostridium sp.]|uniref:alginate O-acetyltransferase AlgX-related protein n=1 Tax=uncultured Clostridium sp. TaxID=59620 RepID=UPI0025FD5382|nr:hypothetical protein [uncultured Clostridium sp.]
MIRKINKYTITALLFLVTIFAIGILNFNQLKDNIQNTLRDKNIKNVEQAISSIEDNYNEHFYNRTEFIDFYGLLQKKMNKNEVSNFDVVRDKKGGLHYQYFADRPNDVSTIVDSISKYQEYVTSIGIDLVYVNPPDKVIRGITEFEKGLPYNMANETADKFLGELKKRDIDYLDLREDILDSGIERDELFFKTDHHWTPETAFWAFNRLVAKLEEEYDFDLDKDGFYTNKENYNFKTYKEFFLGSLGRRTGKLYSGLDDFTLITPKFDTEYTAIGKNPYYPEGPSEIKGRFEDVIVDRFWSLDPNAKVEERDRYSAYLVSNRPEHKILNNLNKNGPKVLIIKDSFMMPVSAFLSTVCSEITLIDPRYYHEKDMYQYTRDYKPDIVIVSFSEANLTDEFFHFEEK